MVCKGSWSLGLVAGTCVLTFAETFMNFSVPHLCTNTALVVTFTTNGKICVLESPLSKSLLWTAFLEIPIFSMLPVIVFKQDMCGREPCDL